jgi:hypothetical protein
MVMFVLCLKFIYVTSLLGRNEVRAEYPNGLLAKLETENMYSSIKVWISDLLFESQIHGRGAGGGGCAIFLFVQNYLH